MKINLRKKAMISLKKYNYLKHLPVLTSSIIKIPNKKYIEDNYIDII